MLKSPEEVPRTEHKPGDTAKLKRSMGLWDACNLVIGSLIGSGIFVSTTEALQSVDMSVPAAMLAWIVGAIISLLGALCFAELGCMLPSAGGEYEYLKTSFGRFWGFIFTWTQLTVYASGSIALMCYISGGYFVSTFFPQVADPGSLTAIVACTLVGILTCLNCLGIRMGSGIQNLFTAGKVAGIASILLLGAFVLPQRVNHNPLDSEGFANTLATWDLEFTAKFGGAVIACLWAYDGWNNLSRVTEEVRDVNRTLPRALFISISAAAFIYLATNTMYFLCLSPREIASSSKVAIDAVKVLSSDISWLQSTDLSRLVGGLIFFSAAGSANGSIISAPRIYYAAARDGLFFNIFCKLNPKTLAPVAALILQGSVAITLIMLGKNLSNILSYFSFSAWVFYGLSAVALIRMRSTHANLPRPMKVPFHPWVPIIFLCFACYLVLSQIVTSPMGSLASMGCIALGTVVYPLFKQRALP